MKFKVFRKEEVTEEVINNFFSNNIIHKDQYLENGDIYVFYNEKNDLEMESMDKLERVQAVIMKAKQDIFDSKVGAQEEIAELEEVRKLIAESNPNKGKEWIDLQERRTRTERQIKMHQETVSTREKQLVQLNATYNTILLGNEITIDVPKEEVKEEVEAPVEEKKAKKKGQ